MRYTSDQKAIHVAKDQLKAHLLALRLFQDQIHVVLRSYGRIVLATGHYLRLAFKPLLFVIVPMTFLIVQLDRYLGSDSARHGPILSWSRLAWIIPTFLNEASLQLPDGLATSAPAVHVPAENEVVWRVVAAKTGDYDVSVQVSDQTFSKSVVVGSGHAASIVDAPARKILGTHFRLGGVRVSRTTNSFKPSTSNTPTATSPSPASNGTGSGCSSFCRWPSGFLFKSILGIEI